MSTTRWIWWCEEHQGSASFDALTVCPTAETSGTGRFCRMEKLVLVDPDNLPPEAIQRAARAIRKGWEDYTGTGEMVSEQAAEAAVRAFLSDPEGDQT